MQENYAASDNKNDNKTVLSGITGSLLVQIFLNFPPNKIFYFTTKQEFYLSKFPSQQNILLYTKQEVYPSKFP